MPPAARAFPWHVAGVRLVVRELRMQAIVFPWLVTVVLHEPATHRARILSLFHLGLMRQAPVGALLIGYLVALAGPRGAAVYPAACMPLVLVGLLLRARLWRQGQAR